MTKLRNPWWLIVFIILFPGCMSMIGLYDQARLSKQVTALTGVVGCHEKSFQTTVVVAYQNHGSKTKVAGYTVLHEPGPYVLLVEPGDYLLAAFVDLNANLTYDPGEPIGYYGRPDIITAGRGEVISVLNIMMSSPVEPVQAEGSGLPAGTVIEEDREKPLHSTLVGAPLDLEDERFSEDAGQRAYWEPVDFFKDMGANIYFVEPYDPAKIPVLFIHGAAGSPQDWRYFINHLDREKYQAWVYFYPSGWPIKTCSNLLSMKLQNLHRKHKFNRLYITAHSMGGLVARSMLVDYGKTYLPYVKLLVSISTPWGGDERARRALDKNVLIVPSWKDVATGSPFMKNIYEQKLPAGIDYYLFFGHRDDENHLAPQSDGAATLVSQLNATILSESQGAFGFNEDHTSILSSPEVMAQYQFILDEAGGIEDEKAPIVVTGSLRLEYTFDPHWTAPPRVFLLLAPQGEEGMVYQLKLPKPGEEIGPIRPGVYDVAVIFPGFRSRQHYHRLEIAPEQVETVHFDLTPQGLWFGHVGMNLGPEDEYFGTDRKPANSIEYKRITLTGQGGKRVLVSEAVKGEFDYFKQIALNKDFFNQDTATFCFFNLEEGEYQIRIEAVGYKTYTEKRQVTPGSLGPIRTIRLEKSPDM